MTHDSLITAALLGTNRMGSLPPPPHPLLEATWLAIPREDPAKAMLQALALTQALQAAGTRAGTVAHGAGERGTGEEADSRPVLSTAAVEALGRMLRGEFQEVLPEWLDLAVASGQVLPGRVFPELLENCAKLPSLRLFVRQLAGSRGHWVARHHPEHEWLAGGDPIVSEDAWETGTPAERLAWLERTRSLDPVVARDSLASSWAGEDGSMREAIIGIVARSPHAEDVPWLERVVSEDRRKEIRELAADALMDLPDSAFRQRALARARAHVQLREGTILVEPPAVFDPAWEKDGLREKPPGTMGEKAWWLRQIIGRVPPGLWPDLLGCDPVELFGIPAGGDWGDALLAAWVDSAMRCPGHALPGYFIPFIATLDPWPQGMPDRHAVLASLSGALPAGGCHVLLESIAGNLAPPAVLELVARRGILPPPSEVPTLYGILATALAAVPAVMDRPRARALAACVPPAEITDQLVALSRLPALSSAAEEFATVLEFRRSLPAFFITSSQSS